MEQVGPQENAAQIAAVQSELHAQETNRVGRWVATTVAAAAILIPATNVATVEHVGEAKPYQFTDVHYDQPYPSQQDTAPGVDPASITSTELWLSLPEDPLVTHRDDRAAELYKQHPTDHPDVIGAMAQYEIDAHIAKKDKQTVFDPVPTLRALYTDYGKQDLSEQTMPESEYITIANKYLANFDIQITLDTPGTEYFENTQAASLDDLRRSGNAKNNIVNLVKAFSHLPAEYVTPLGIHRILLGTQQVGAPEAQMNAFVFMMPVKGFDDAMFINMDMFTPEGIIYHELGHRVDENQSSTEKAANHDNAFATAAHHVPYGLANATTLRGEKAGYLTLASYDTKDGYNRLEMREYAHRPDCIQHAGELATQIHADAKRTAYPSAYAGQVNITEHKAEVIATIPQDFQYREHLDPALPLIREQVVLELARLGMYQPRTERYFIDRSVRPVPNQTPYRSLCK